MAFKVAFIAHVSGANPEKHRCMIATPKYKLFVRLVGLFDQGRVIKECKKLVKEEGIQSILLCPGFTHGNVAEIAAVVGNDVAVSVARGDGLSNIVSAQVRRKELMSGVCPVCGTKGEGSFLPTLVRLQKKGSSKSR